MLLFYFANRSHYSTEIDFGYPTYRVARQFPGLFCPTVSSNKNPLFESSFWLEEAEVSILITLNTPYPTLSNIGTCPFFGGGGQFELGVRVSYSEGTKDNLDWPFALLYFDTIEPGHWVQLRVVSLPFNILLLVNNEVIGGQFWWPTISLVFPCAREHNYILLYQSLFIMHIQINCVILQIKMTI